MGYGPEEEYNPEVTGDKTVGGLARVAAKIAELKALDENTVVVGAGDFSMGSLFHIPFTTNPVELPLLQMSGYDCVTLGNHEFDWGPAALAASIAGAMTAGGGQTIPIVCSNIHFDEESAADDGLAALYGEPGEEGKAIFPYYLKTLPNGLNVGIIGLMGLNASAVAPMKAPVTFSGETAADFPTLLADAQAAALNVRSKGADVVVCLAHLGVASSYTSGESLGLAQAIDEIDFIISAHSHTLIPQPIAFSHENQRTTYVAEAGNNLRFLGRITAEEAESPALGFLLDEENSGYFTIDSLITAPESPIQTMILEQIIPALDNGFLLSAGFTYFQRIGSVTADLLPAEFAESNIEDMVTDSILFYLEQVAGDVAVPRIAVHANGVVRDGLLLGNSGHISVADAFRVLPLGIGTDMVPGYSLLRFYLTPAEVRGAMELGVTEGLTDDQMFLNYSGARITYDPELPPYDQYVPASGRIIKIELGPDGGPYETVFDVQLSPETMGWLIDPLRTLWAIETDEYIGSFMSLYGLAPRDEAGIPGEVSDFIVEVAPGAHAKEWMGFLAYIQHMTAEYDGLNPMYYEAVPRRILPVEYLPLGVYLTMPSHVFHRGDSVSLDAIITIPQEFEQETAPLFVLLDIGTGTDYWFWPSWRHYPSEGVDFQTKTLTPGRTTVPIIPAFEWPEVEGSLSGVSFIGAILDEPMTSILGNFGTWTFGYE